MILFACRNYPGLARLSFGFAKLSITVHMQGLDVGDSDPVFDQQPLALMDVKLDSDDGPRPEADLNDFELRQEFCRL